MTYKCYQSTTHKCNADIETQGAPPLCLGSIFIFVKHIKHKPLSLPQRYQIELLRKTSLIQTQIASTLSVHNSTLCRELKRNTPTRDRTAGQYIGEPAQGKID